jgi:hypothetical protein
MAIIDKPSNYFNTKLYTGNNNVTQTISGVGFQPDWVWIKNRDNVENHYLFDAVRGSGAILNSSSTNAEADLPVNTKPTIASDGFTLTSNGSNDELNFGTRTYVSWNWKAGGTASSNTDGSITSSVSANQDAGFSIVSYTGTGNDPETIGHGLGVTPSMIIVKDRNTAGGWRVYHKSVGNDKVLALDGNIAGTTSDAWNSTTPTPSLFTVGNDTITNGNGTTHIAYCFADVQGFSKFGNYTGNGNADGTFVYLGFKPAFVMVKRTDATENWYMKDNKRDIFNPVDNALYANSSAAELTDWGGATTDYLSNGFKLKTTDSAHNASGGTYIYMAFAEKSIRFINWCTSYCEIMTKKKSAITLAQQSVGIRLSSHEKLCSERMSNLITSIQRLEKKVDILSDSVSKGKGIVSVLVFLGTIVAAAIGFFNYK